ncbi:MAG: alpha/beta hydrolase [Planctomycetota bacterium]
MMMKIALVVLALSVLQVSAGAPEPKATHTVEAAGVELRVREWGQGDAMVCLAGGPGFHVDQMMSTAQSVAKTHRALLLDQRGTGGSPVGEPFDPGQFSIAQAVGDLEAVRASLGLEQWGLVGHSWGGLLAMAYAAEHPDRVSKLILVSPAGIDASFWQGYQVAIMTRLDDKGRAALAALQPPEEQTLEAYAELSRQSNLAIAGATVGSGAREGAVDALRAEMREGFDGRIGLAMQQHLMGYDFSEQLKSMEAPVVVIQGSEDPIGSDVGERIVETLPNAERLEIEGCGHWPFHEMPDAYADVLAKALGG